MKTRMTAILAILSLAAWLPVMSRQTSAPASADPAVKSACACCDHQKTPGDQADSSKAMSCCHGKDMTCCKKDKDNQSAMNCCSGKDAKQCAAKNGKGCCGGDAMASNTKGKGCCGSDSTCCHGTQG